jgi:hypothetical protein
MAGNYLLLESGDTVLLESGDRLLLEVAASGVVVGTSQFASRFPTRRYASKGLSR